MTAAPAVPADWMSLGACRDADPDLFFPIGSLGPAQRQIAQAKAVCAACPVRTACLRYALDSGQRAGRARRAELVRLPGGHYAAFLDAHEQAVAAELTFLRLHLLGQPRPGSSAPVTSGANSSGDGRV